MIRNYYTLSAVVRTCDKLIGCAVTACFSQEKNVLIIEFYDGVGFDYIRFSADTVLTSICKLKNFNRAGKNSTDLFPALLGDSLQSVELDNSDRIVRFRFINSDIHFYLYGGAKSNSLLTDKQSVVRDAFKNRKEHLNCVINQENVSALQNKELDDSIKVVSYLTSPPFLFSKQYAHELLKTRGIDPPTLLSELQTAEFSKLTELSTKFSELLKTADEFYVYKLPDGNTLFSLIELGGFSEEPRIYDDPSKALMYRLANTYKTVSIDSAKKSLTGILTRMISKYRDALQKHADDGDHLKRADEYKLFGELLLALPDQKQTGRTSCELTDYEGNSRIIKLDPKLSTNDNAANYFRKAKNTVENVKRRKLLIPRTEARLKDATDALDLLDKAVDIKSVAKIKNLIVKIPDSKMQDVESNEIKYRVFDLGEGWTLYVGKNAANNDELTMKFARPNDLWFHARGSSGSHAVLRVEGSTKPPKHIIKKAAAVAAYYSGAKNAKYTPVCYTFKKNVSKYKGAAPGSVTVAREEVIMVEPKLPEGYE